MKYKIKIINNKYKSDIFIYSKDPLNAIKKFFKKNECFFFQLEKKIIYINIRIIYLIIINFFKFGSLKLSLLASLIQYLNPAVIITLIDNDPNFWILCEKLKSKYKFISIQNGSRYDLYKNPSIKNLNIQEYLCFGSHEKEIIEELGGQVDNYHICGSYKETLFKESSPIYRQMKENKLVQEYDLCLIADNYDGWDKVYPNLEKSASLVAEFGIRYAKENNLKIVFCFKRTEDFVSERCSEREFYMRYLDLNQEQLYFSYRDSQWTSYETICKSNIIIGFSSTLLLEAASMGKKVLICDYYSKEFSLGAKKPLALNDQSKKYHNFSKKIDEILTMSNEEYSSTRHEEVNRMIHTKNFETILTSLTNDIL